MLASDPVFARHHHWRLLDDAGTADGGDVAAQLDADLALIDAVGRGEAPPSLRLWRHRKALVSGYRDTRLPGWQAAAAQWRQAGYSVAVRASGGAAVPLDAGVLNLALVYPTAEFGIEAGFAAAHALVAAVGAGLGLSAQVGLVPGGYCPGESDLAVAGRKFAGVSQRRTRLATLVHVFIVVSGRGEHRARRAAQFYAVAGVGAPASAFPDVAPGSTASLTELRGGTCTTHATVRRHLAALLPSGVGVALGLGL